ncbi:hypothetical protein [Enhygromyxa salina]|uniref:Uncharacterized protein n=1 Tax=Enhygromyxa salina TaxID=215803 RepID=A0A2S9YDN6_9BACT|nr:hypothetical protein [Enhygromyxa salina]PRQ03230.1 hypothetical protein ENSA7_53070 [Enhygromyxa salina]
MLMKASYVLLSVTSLGLLMFEAPRGALLTTTPERGKVQRDTQEAGSGNATIRRPHYIFLGGYHGGK